MNGTHIVFFGLVILSIYLARKDRKDTKMQTLIQDLTAAVTKVSDATRTVTTTLNDVRAQLDAIQKQGSLTAEDTAALTSAIGTLDALAATLASSVAGTPPGIPSPPAG